MRFARPERQMYNPSRIIVGMVVLAILSACQTLYAQDYSSGSTSDQARQQAISSIPFAKLPNPSKQRVSDVIRNSSIYRRLPKTTINCDPDLYLFLVRYPEVLVNIWQIMDVSKMTATRSGPYSLTTKDGVGTEAKIDLLYGSPNLNIYYGEGSYAGPLLLGRVAGQCILILHTDYHRGADGKLQASSELDVFLKIDHLAAGIIARTVHPLVGSTADHNYVETLKFLQKLSETSETNGAGVQRLAMRLTNTHPEVRRRFAEMVAMVYHRANPSQSVGPVAATSGQEAVQNHAVSGGSGHRTPARPAAEAGR